MKVVLRYIPNNPVRLGNRTINVPVGTSFIAPNVLNLFVHNVSSAKQITMIDNLRFDRRLVDTVLKGHVLQNSFVLIFFCLINVNNKLIVVDVLHNLFVMLQLSEFCKIAQ